VQGEACSRIQRTSLFIPPLTPRSTAGPWQKLASTLANGQQALAPDLPHTPGRQGSHAQLPAMMSAHHMPHVTWLRPPLPQQCTRKGRCNQHTSLHCRCHHVLHTRPVNVCQHCGHHNLLVLHCCWAAGFWLKQGYRHTCDDCCPRRTRRQRAVSTAGLQRDHLCLWPDWDRQNTYHAGSSNLGPFLSVCSRSSRRCSSTGGRGSSSGGGRATVVNHGTHTQGSG
jgi:hypothetical protein